jgi:uncharacterized protein YdaL
METKKLVLSSVAVWTLIFADKVYAQNSPQWAKIIKIINSIKF